ncbi:MAG: hypothetical protein AXW15_07830 [Neptuniibacter sp. Phe_28]|nr:MAG: hypothetical protein AXW15_07830 [Neptuniibacter sp. Phe_28]
MRSAILTAALLLSTHANADKWDFMVCDAFTDSAEKRQCISKAKAKIHKERTQAELLKKSEERLAAEKQRHKSSTSSSVVYSKKCKDNFTCWVNEKSNMLEDMDAKIACSKAIQMHAKYQHKWSGMKYPRFYRPTSGMHPLTVGYGGDNIMFQNGFGVWQPHSYLCWYDYLQNSIISVSVIPGKGRH